MSPTRVKQHGIVLESFPPPCCSPRRARGARAREALPPCLRRGLPRPSWPCDGAVQAQGLAGGRAGGTSWRRASQLRASRRARRRCDLTAVRPGDGRANVGRVLLHPVVARPTLRETCWCAETYTFSSYWLAIARKSVGLDGSWPGRARASATSRRYITVRPVARRRSMASGRTSSQMARSKSSSAA